MWKISLAAIVKRPLSQAIAHTCARIRSFVCGCVQIPFTSAVQKVGDSSHQMPLWDIVLGVDKGGGESGDNFGRGVGGGGANVSAMAWTPLYFLSAPHNIASIMAFCTPPRPPPSKIGHPHSSTAP